MSNFTARHLLASTFLAFLAATANAHDRILTIGGGNSASNSQTSLEKNVLFLQSYLHEANLDSLPHDILFTDGNGGARDVQFEDPNATLPRVNDLLAQLAGGENLLLAQYRAHAIPNLTDASNRASLNKWFDRVAPSMTADDRLIIYYTGHGGRGNKDHGTTIALWGEDDMSVQEFRKLFDKLPPKVPVILIMAQCFSGGYGDLIYNEADANKGLAARKICGFFATVADRIAAGCTSDVNEADYKEYSTYFWSALSGHARASTTAVQADYNNDGRVSFAEAHAYTVITSDTIDIPLKTSEVLLRKFATAKPRPTTGPSTAPAATRPSFESDYAALRAAASPLDGVVLDALAKSLNLEGKNLVQSAKALADKIQKQKAAIDDKRNKARDNCYRLRAVIRRRIWDHWPELHNLFHPRVVALLTTNGDEIVKMIESAPQYAEFEDLYKKFNDLEEESFNVERKWIKTQRFLRAAETVSLAADLPQRAPADVVGRYHTMLQMENTGLEK